MFKSGSRGYLGLFLGGQFPKFSKASNRASANRSCFILSDLSKHVLLTELGPSDCGLGSQSGCIHLIIPSYAGP